MHCWAVVCWHSWYQLDIFCCLFVLEWSVYQGACYYMDFFAKKYEIQLRKLVQFEESVVTPSSKEQQSAVDPKAQTEAEKAVESEDDWPVPPSEKKTQ